MTETCRLPVIGAGPIGLAAAAHLIERGLPVRVYEAGATVGASIRDWAHVRVFSPWRYNVDAAAQRAARAPVAGRCRRRTRCRPATELYDALSAAARRDARAGAGHRDRRPGRRRSRGSGWTRSTSRGRAQSRLRAASTDGDGATRHELARAVIDASGTWTQPNPLGGDGLPAAGELEHAGRIAYGMPDVLGRDRAAYAGRHTLVVGAGYSAANVLLDLVRACRGGPGTAIAWVVRGTNLARVYGGGEADQLPARGELGARLRQAGRAGRDHPGPGFAATAVEAAGGRLALEGETADGPRRLGPVDRIVVATGQRPDLAMTRELRLELDPWLESVRALGPLIDPNLHSCGSVAAARPPRARPSRSRASTPSASRATAARRPSCC